MKKIFSASLLGLFALPFLTLQTVWATPSYTGEIELRVQLIEELKQEIKALEEELKTLRRLQKEEQEARKEPVKRTWFERWYNRWFVSPEEEIVSQNTTDFEYEQEVIEAEVAEEELAWKPYPWHQYTFWIPADWEVVPSLYRTPAQMAENKEPDVVGLLFKPIAEPERTPEAFYFGGRQASCIHLNIEKPGYCVRQTKEDSYFVEAYPDHNDRPDGTPFSGNLKYQDIFEEMVERLEF